MNPANPAPRERGPRKTLVTCAVTGNLTRPEQTPYLPITPAQIASECLAAAEAGAAMVHIHVRDPLSGAPSMELDLYGEVVERIRAQHRELVINLTTGPGGRFVPDPENPRVAAPGTTLLPPLARVAHITLLKPDVCSLDLNTMNSGSQVVINTPHSVRVMARAIRAAGVLPELEIFDSGDIHLALDLIAEGTLDSPGLWSFVTGVKYGFSASGPTLQYASGLIPRGAHWSAFGIGRHAFPMVAQAWLLGGHVRVGLEDNIYLAHGELANGNAALVRKAVGMLRDLGGAPMTPAEARAALGLSAVERAVL